MTKKEIVRIAITGGIGCGKSYICHQIEAEGFPIFYCDDEAKKIIRTDTKVKEALKSLVGDSVYTDGGTLNKDVLRDFICQDQSHANQVDAIVHPRVGEIFQEWCQSQSTSKVFMECAILFESGFNRYVDKVIYISAPLETRIARVMQRDGVSREKALGWMALQMPEEEKSQLSDYIIQNDGKRDTKSQIWQILV